MAGREAFLEVGEAGRLSGEGEGEMVNYGAFHLGERRVPLGEGMRRWG